MHADFQTPTYASDMRILMENMQALNVNNRQEGSLINSTSFKDKERRSMIPIRHYTLQSYNSNQSLAHPQETSDVRTVRFTKTTYISFRIIKMSLRTAVRWVDNKE